MQAQFCSGSSTSTTYSRPRSKSEIRLRKPRPSTLIIPNSSKRPPVLRLCQSLPQSLDALDLSSASPTQTLASLRFILLSYLADLEQRIAQFESPDVQAWIAKKKGELDNDAAIWAQTALEMLHRIRDDVCSHFPDVPHITDIAAVEAFIKSHLPDLPDLTALQDMRAQMTAHLPDMQGMRSHLPDIPHIPDMQEMCSHLPDMPQLPANVKSTLDDARAKFDDVALRFHDLDFERPLSFLPTLSTHLKNLHSHLSSMELPSMDLGAPTTAILSDLMDSLLSSDIMAEIAYTAEHVIEEGEDMLEKAAQEVTGAVKRSLEGMCLITYNDLPHPWKNNPFVTQGYRFIPIERWPLIVMSMFKFHNETLNIHTHLIPFLFWFLNLIVLCTTAPTDNLDTPELLFMCFALLCLFFSTVWHTMAGCADHKSMEFCARADYVGIGWLISATVGTVVYYGFRCHGENIGRWYLGLSCLTGIAGNVFPFMKWFNMHEYRMYRIAFFLAMAFSAIGPMVSLSYLHSAKEMHNFIRPVIPSLVSYVTGLVFYAAHFPERALPAGVRSHLDRIGCGSHAIWHCFIVLAVS